MDKITMEDIMQWIEAQRTEANARLSALGDGDESHVEYSSDAKAVRIINAIVDRMGEMTAVEYLEALNEECAKHEGVYGGKNRPCSRCPFDGNCIYGDNPDPRRAVEIMKRWKESGRMVQKVCDRCGKYVPDNYDLCRECGEELYSELMTLCMMIKRKRADADIEAKEEQSDV